MIPSAETAQKMAEWQAKQDAGTMTLDDWREAMRTLRSDRSGAQAASAASKARKAPADVNVLKDSLRALRKP